MLDRNEAIVNVLAIADGLSAFREEVVQGLDAIGFDLVELEDSEPLAERRATNVVSAELLTLVSEVEATGTPRFGRFHTWRSEEEDS